MEENEIKTMLDEEIKSEIQNLSNLEVGSKELEIATASVANLYRLKLEEVKAEREHANNAEMELKQAQFKEQTRHQYIRLGLDAASLVVPMIFYGIWMHKGFKFEETGTFTSTTFRGLFNRFKPTKN